MANVYGRQVVVPLTNKSGGGVIAGDVVIVDTGNNDAFTTSTAGAFTGLIGVAQETIASNASGRVLTAGYAALVNVNASVTRGNFGKSHTVVKQATDAGSSRVAGTFCQFLTGGTTPDAHLFGLADNTSGAGTGTLTTVEEVDTSPTDSAVTKLVFPNSTLGIAAHVATYTPALPRTLFILGTQSPQSTTGGAWTETIDVTYQFGSYANSSGAQNDTRSWSILLDSGTYSFDLYHLKGTNRGIYTVKIDGSSVGTIDGYNAGGTINATTHLTGITVATAGYHTLDLVMATKNASSSSYFGLPNGLSMTRTGA